MSGAMREPLSPAAIEVLTAHLGLTLDAQQRDELLTSSQALVRVLSRLRQDLPRSAEPAHVFAPLRFLPIAADTPINEGNDL